MPSNAAQRQRDGETRANTTPTVKLWDGHKRIAVEWTGLHREPKLWTAKGDCLVYLYGKGHCNAGASFRIDFSALVRKRCYAFVKKYVDWQGLEFALPKTDDDWDRFYPKRMVSLYVPAAPGSTRSEISQQHLSIRNFLAWVTGLPLVGTHLGGEILALFRNMVLYRPFDTDSTTDLLAYLECAGYLDIVAQQNHALAVLYVAESLRQRDLYTRAFVHCVGLGERLYQSTEYTKISLVSRKLIRTASHDLKAKLDGAVEDLGSFLDEELSESRLGLPHGVRAHLDRFRSALSTFYTAKFGYFPPRDFDAKAVQAMSEDFEALYDLLVDDGAGTPGMVGGNNGGGLCMLQIIRTFDSRNSFETRQHPLPLLPTASEVLRKTRRMPWLGRGEMEKPTNRLVAHTALIKASNWRESSFKNGLVRMYRDFEGKSLEPSANKMDKSENVSITDARKVRWILIYAMCQVLRNISKQVPQVAGERAPYFLSASAADLPPWNTAIDTGMDVPILNSALPTMPECADEPWQPRFADGMEIKPDVDYFALTHGAERQRPEKLGRRQSMPVTQATVSPTTLSPSKPGTGNAIARRSTIRNSIRRRLRPGSASSATAPSFSPTKSAYHEIVIHGYGNGTNDVKLERRNTVGCDNSEAGRIPSASLPSHPRLPNITSPAFKHEPTPAQSRRSSNRSSNASSIGTLDSQAASGSASPATIITPEFEQTAVEPIIVRNSSHKSLTQRYPMKSVLETIGRTSSKRRGSLAGTAGQELPLPPTSQQQQQPPFTSGLSRAVSVRKSLLPESWTLAGRTATFEQDINEEDEVVTLQSEADEWVAMQAFLDDDDELDGRMAHKGATPGWEQYNDLGGLTEVR
ncbi:uncharacterized protein LMH87_008928 [Akanthomyces muscarius]|uniref:DUF8004 domain-containing protein n=1 Tax=Akanthomyces muscarius TaxID=2231603 RepID=A0A9W8QHA3_AKAMU|nr:uncharacterized protein LMH87_008928 [Akanthomyces muscarius]KAJ4158401.1 hypothetical protein LMH87_008928 [Akanthomyces muscarius]